VIRGLAIAGDVFWIVALALMASFTLAAWRRLSADAQVPVLWRGKAVVARLPRWAALTALPLAAFAIGVWLQIASRSPGLDLMGAVICLGVRVSLAPLFALLHMGRVQRALEIMADEGALGPPR
jgi:hypothetical protein